MKRLHFGLALIFGGLAAAETGQSLSVDERVAKMYPMPVFEPLEKLTKNWSAVPNELFPEIVTVEAKVTYDLIFDGEVLGKTSADPGHKSKPLELKPGGVLVLTNQRDGSSRGEVDVAKTDFQKIIIEAYNAKIDDAKSRVVHSRKIAKASIIERASEGEGKLDPAPNGDPRFQPVREFLAAGKLESGILEEAKRWLWIGPETHRGGEFDVVLVYFEVDTIFGIFPNSMKCLLKDGKVVKWVDAQTNEERD